MSFAIPAWDIPSLPVASSADRYPVRRIYCIGRNYAAHAREMGADEREPPFFFLKPADAIVQDGETIPYPAATGNLHYEAELVAAIGKPGKNIPVENANDHIFGYGVGIDLTRRDLQDEAKQMRRPWDMGKAFDQSAPCSAIHPVASVGHPAKGAIWLKVNGETKQSGDLTELIWSVPESIAYLSGLVELMPGDLIYTGTPAGVGAVIKGDRIQVHVNGVCELNIAIG
ncbi:MAG: FAA hydrolase family protein [Alphaproteobacteria bacterium]|nr:FAA hydrolase family protein [Alphaproteobacteria bacterium]